MSFISNVKNELLKIKTPTKSEVIQSSIMLIVVLFVTAILLSLLDYLLSFISLLFS
ncbi:preprotein translocase subunit SecE [Candidatus Deianiraea vastatrix]|uniref:Preprotein translocase subunit SecE n=1 Tax=Candidatus Deianiraea vastatrix TaxID=2163644 RepID=A0A5B8XHL0_9RICK|nr:preprotein translocase subunit SecE [Candidatus Deianiraea vastatrix]QED23287.1 Preprotein translocase subunit SecE [Candidatus Deianiraea vastatrix]